MSMTGTVEKYAVHVVGGQGPLDDARARVAEAKALAASLEQALARAEARLASLREVPQKMMRQGAISLAAAAAAPMADADLQSVRALRTMPQPSPTVQLVVRCACSILTVDLPGSKKMTALLTWEEAKKVLSRTDFALCVKQFNAANLLDQDELVALVKKNARWAAAASSDGVGVGRTDVVTLASALASSSAVGSLFGWCSRLLSGLESLSTACVPSAEVLEATAAAERQVGERQAEWEGALTSVQRAERHLEEEQRHFDETERARKEAARREAIAKARREAEEVMRLEQERARLAAEEKARREAEEKARREAEEKAKQEAAKARREAEEKARREAEEKAKQEAAKARREAEEKARREAEEKARREAEEAEAALREVESELRRIEEASRRAEERELARAAAFKRYLACERERLEVELASSGEMNLHLVVQMMQADDERAMGQLLDETRKAAVDELLVLAPNAGRDRCRGLLERCEWTVADAACELLALDCDRPILVAALPTPAAASRIARETRR